MYFAASIARRARIVLFGLIAVTIAACAPTSSSMQAATQPGPAPDYVIGPGDTLKIFVWQNPDLSATIPVRPDGRISLPLI